VFKTLGLLTMLLGVSMLIPFAVAVLYQDNGLQVLAMSSAVTFVIGFVLFVLCNRAGEQIRSRSAFFLVTAAWFSATVFGALPYYFSDMGLSLVDAWFESASGFTTTGATILTDIEATPKSILLWRSLTQFLGGMGIIVLSLAVLPLLGVGGMDLYRAEVPGPTSDKISARVSETARALWMVYLVFALVQTFVLCAFGMSLFDAVNHALTTMATGGFSTRNASIAAFDSAAIEFVVTFFMFLAGANFILHYRALVKGDFSLVADRELRFYTAITVGSILIVSAALWGVHYDTFGQAIRYGAFQVVSILTTTGYGTADYLLWGAFSQVLLLGLMVIGGSAGSTSGGIKCIRAMLLIKQGYRELYRMIHPKAVVSLKLGDSAVPAGVSSSVFGFFFLYITLVGATTLALTACGVDILTALSGVVSALSNVGPGLGEIGPMLNYSGLPDLAKILLCACMIVGRLEIMTVLVLFTSEYWSS